MSYKSGLGGLGMGDGLGVGERGRVKRHHDGDATSGIGRNLTPEKPLGIHKDNPR